MSTGEPRLPERSSGKSAHKIGDFVCVRPNRTAPMLGRALGFALLAVCSATQSKKQEHKLELSQIAHLNFR